MLTNTNIYKKNLMNEKSKYLGQFYLDYYKLIIRKFFKSIED